MQYVAVRPPPGPRSAGLNPAAALWPAAVSDYEGLFCSISHPAEHQGPRAFRQASPTQMGAELFGGLSSAKLPPSCLRVAILPAMLPPSCLQDASKSLKIATWPNLASSSTPSKCLKPTKTKGFAMFCYFTTLRFKMP